MYVALAESLEVLQAPESAEVMDHCERRDDHDEHT